MKTTLIVTTAVWIAGLASFLSAQENEMSFVITSACVLIAEWFDNRSAG